MKLMASLYATSLERAVMRAYDRVAIPTVAVVA